MRITLTCACTEALDLTDDCAGNTTICPACGAALDVPPLGIPAARRSLAGLRGSSNANKRMTAPFSDTRPSNRPWALFGTWAILLALVVAVLITRSGAGHDERSKPITAVSGTTVKAQMPAHDAGPAPPLPQSKKNADRTLPTLSQVIESIPARRHAEAPAPFFLKMLNEVDQQIKSEGDVKHIRQSHLLWSKWERQEPALGVSRWTQAIERIKFEVSSGFQTVHFDSSRPADAATALGTALLGGRIDIAVVHEGSVVRASGSDELFAGLPAGVDPEIKLAIEALLRTDSQERLADGLFCVIPEHEVRKGETWSRQRPLPPLLGGRLTGGFQYTYVGRVEGLEKIFVTSTIQFEPPRAEPGSPVSDLKINLTGYLLYDSTKHRIAASTTERQIEGKLMVRRGTQDLPLEVFSKQKTTVETSDIGQLK